MAVSRRAGESTDPGEREEIIERGEVGWLGGARGIEAREECAPPTTPGSRTP